MHFIYVSADVLLGGNLPSVVAFWLVTGWTMRRFSPFVNMSCEFSSMHSRYSCFCVRPRGQMVSELSYHYRYLYLHLFISRTQTQWRISCKLRPYTKYLAIIIIRWHTHGWQSGCYSVSRTGGGCVGGVSGQGVCLQSSFHVIVVWFLCSWETHAWLLQDVS